MFNFFKKTSFEGPFVFGLGYPGWADMDGERVIVVERTTSDSLVLDAKSETLLQLAHQALSVKDFDSFIRSEGKDPKVFLDQLLAEDLALVWDWDDLTVFDDLCVKILGTPTVAFGDVANNWKASGLYKCPNGASVKVRSPLHSLSAFTSSGEAGIKYSAKILSEEFNAPYDQYMRSALEDMIVLMRNDGCVLDRATGF